VLWPTPTLCAINRWLRPAAESLRTSRIFLIDNLAFGIPPPLFLSKKG
jgi:hypothetical protein